MASNNSSVHHSTAMDEDPFIDLSGSRNKKRPRASTGATPVITSIDSDSAPIPAPRQSPPKKRSKGKGKRVDTSLIPAASVTDSIPATVSVTSIPPKLASRQLRLGESSTGGFLQPLLSIYSHIISVARSTVVTPTTTFQGGFSRLGMSLSFVHSINLLFSYSRGWFF
jgi:hypothetical protein